MNCDNSYEPEWLQRSSSFTLWWNYSDRLAEKPVAAFLAAILADADECLCYGLVAGSDAWGEVESLVRRDGRRHRVEQPLYLLAGKDVFWQANACSRSTILISIPVGRFPGRIFTSCPGNAMVLENYRNGHSKSAIEVAKRKLATGSHVVIAIPQSLYRAEVFAPEYLLFDLYAEASRECRDAA